MFTVPIYADGSSPSMNFLYPPVHSLPSGPILCAPNQLKYISNRFVKQDFIAWEFSKSLADLQIWYGSVRVHRESGAWRNMVKKSQSDCTITLRMAADWGGSLWSRWKGGKMRGREEAGSSCPVIFTHVKSDTLTVWIFFFFPSPGRYQTMEEKLSAVIPIGS